MKRITKSAVLAVAIGSVLGAGMASAQVTATVGGSAQASANYVSFDGVTGNSTTPYTSGALTVDFGTDAQTVLTPNTYGSAQPYLSGNNNLNFGSIYNGPDTTTYLTAGIEGPNSSPITFNFSTGQNYFGLLWGSVDANNTLTFWSGPNGTGSVLETITGTDLNTLNNEIAQTGYGDTSDTWGTAYVNVDTSTPFESVVASTTTFTFEIDNVAYGSTVPDGGMTIALLGGAFAGLQALRRKLSC
jgi:hypothetical protein